MTVVAFKPRKSQPEPPPVAKPAFETLPSETQAALIRLVELMAEAEADKILSERPK